MTPKKKKILIAAALATASYGGIKAKQVYDFNQFIEARRKDHEAVKKMPKVPFECENEKEPGDVKGFVHRKK